MKPIVRFGAFALATLVMSGGLFAQNARVTGSAGKVLAGARKQLVSPARLDLRYVKIGYPVGDVAPDRGACSDVVIRALRHAGYDLQQLIHEDAARFRYPSIPKRDKNIDHRRVRNQRVYFTRYGLSLPLALKGARKDSWQPGDVVTCKLPNGMDHTGIVSDRVGRSGHFMVIHNLGRVAEEDVLGTWKLTGHYRFPKPKP